MTGADIRSEAGFVALKEPPGVLGNIVSRKLADVQKAATARPLTVQIVNDVHKVNGVYTSTVAASTAPIRSFDDALRGGRGAAGIRLIAEIKPRSPSRGQLGASADAADYTALVARARLYDPYAAAISVLCDAPYFGGSLELLAAVRAAVRAPVLCKDFFVSTYQLLQARAFGADAVLLMASLLRPDSLRDLLAAARELGMGALVEVHDAQELAEAVAAGATVIGVNSRDLRTLAIDLPSARALLEKVPTSCVRVAESGLGNAADITALAGLADAALIGTSLMLAADPAGQIEALGFRACS